MAVEVGQASRPLPGESACGDACGWWMSGDRIVLALADGLGHGKEAAYAAQAALRCIAEHLECGCADLFARCDARLRESRGAALAIAIVELGCGRLTLGSVGNIRALLVRDVHGFRLGGARGIIGAGYQPFAPETRVLAPGDVLTLFSDGVAEHLPPGEILADPAACVQTAAQSVLDRWAHAADDAAVLIYRYESPAAGGAP